MKKRLLATLLSLMLVVGLLPTAALAAGTAGTIAARIGVSENSKVKYNGQDTLEIGFYVQSDDMKIRAGQNVLLAIDLEVLDLLVKNGTLLTDTLPSSGAPLQLTGKLAYTTYEDPDTFNVWSGMSYAGKSADGKIGYLMLQPTLIDMNASSIVTETKLMSSIVGFKAGKTKADLAENSIRLATVAEADTYNQSYVMTVNDGDKIDMNMGSVDGKPDTFVIPPVFDMGGLVSTGAATPTNVTLTASSTNVIVGAEVTLTASATVTDSGTLTYSLKDDNGVVVADQASNTFKVTPATIGTKNYYVTATNTLSGKTATADSAKVAVTVTAPPVGGSAQLLTMSTDTVNGFFQKNGGLVGFNPNVTDYSLYFAKGDATAFKIYTEVAASAKTYYSKDNGANYTEYASTIDLTPTTGSLWIKVTETGMTDTIYKIDLVQRADEAPQAVFELTNEGEGISKLHLVSFDRAQLSNFELNLKLTDASMFAGFVTADGNELVDGLADPFELVADGTTFQVSSYKATAGTLTIKFTMGAGNGGFVDASKLQMNIYLKQTNPANPAMPHVAVDSINAETSAVELFGFDGKKWMDDGKNDKATSLIYLMAQEPGYALDMYFNKAGNNKNIANFTYSIKATEAADNLVTNQPLSAQLGKLSTMLDNGTYVVTVKGDGYVTYTKTVTIAGLSQAIPAVMLLGGDLDGNSTIDNTDMLRLLDPSFYNKAVGGIVTGAYDFNGDGQVDILDLGVLVRNMGATY